MRSRHFLMNKSVLLPIEKRVQHHLERYLKNFRREHALILGGSGGPDSMALMYMMHRLKANPLVVHINYQKRGQNADLDQELVEGFALAWGFDCQSFKVDPDEANGQNFQNWARETRYRIFDELKDAYGAEAIVVAHHQDDQIETVLHKLFRGAGLASWKGMPVWDGRLIRPLLETTKAALKAYISDREIPYRMDESNLESDYARNFIRNEWLPEIKEHFPGWRSNILKITEQAKVFEEAVSHLLKDIRFDKKKLLREPLNALSVELQKSLILDLIKEFDPGITVSRGGLREIEKLQDLQTGQQVQLTDQWSLIRDRDHYRLMKDVMTEELPEKIIEKEALKDQALKWGHLKFKLKPYRNPDFSKALYLDTNQLTWPLKLRKWKPGDRFQPLGLNGHQKISDHLTNRKVGAAQKKQSSVLLSFEEIICAVIFPPIEETRPPGTISEGVKCNPNTKFCLEITKAKQRS